MEELTDFQKLALGEIIPLSRGPKTPEGKRRSSQNAVKHGLFSRCVVLKNEDPALFDDLVEQLNQHFRPDDDIQKEFVRQAAVNLWKMRRCISMQTGFINDNLGRPERRAGDERFDIEVRRIVSAFQNAARQPYSLAALENAESRLTARYQSAVKQLTIAKLRRGIQQKSAQEPQPAQPKDSNQQ